MKKENFICSYRLSDIMLGAVFCTAMFLSMGCSNDSEKAVTDTEDRVPLRVSCGIDVVTRAYDDKWEAGDAIGIYMLNGETSEASNKKYTTDAESANGAFTAIEGNTIYFPTDGTTRDFIAYYPYQELEMGNTTYTVDVSKQTTQRAIDLMGAVKVEGKHKNNPKVAFEFIHKLVKLSLDIKADGKSLNADDIKEMTVRLTNQRLKATYDVVEGGSVNVDTQTAPGSIDLLTDPDGTHAEGVVLPNSDTEGMILEFYLSNSSRKYEWAVKQAEKSQRFVEGSKYIYTITITNTGVDVTSTVTDWTPGNGEGESGSAQ